MINIQLVLERLDLRVDRGDSALSIAETLAAILVEEINEQLRYLRVRIDNPPPEDK